MKSINVFPHVNKIDSMILVLNTLLIAFLLNLVSYVECKAQGNNEQVLNLTRNQEMNGILVVPLIIVLVILTTIGVVVYIRYEKKHHDSESNSEESQ